MDKDSAILLTVDMIPPCHLGTNPQSAVAYLAEAIVFAIALELHEMTFP
jgi:hypothetical protein